MVITSGVVTRIPLARDPIRLLWDLNLVLCTVICSHLNCFLIGSIKLIRLGEAVYVDIK